MKHMSTDTHVALLALANMIENGAKACDVAVLLRCIAETGRLSSYAEALENEALLTAKTIDGLRADIRGMMAGAAEDRRRRIGALGDGEIRLCGGGILVMKCGRPHEILFSTNHGNAYLDVALCEASAIWGEELKIGDKSAGRALIVDNTLE